MRSVGFSDKTLSIPEFLDVSSLGLSLTDPISISASPTALATFVLSQADALEDYSDNMMDLKFLIMKLFQSMIWNYSLTLA